MKNLFEMLATLPMTIEDSAQPICITDSKKRIIYVNKAFTRSLGYTYDEVKFKDPKIFLSSSTAQETYDDLETKLETEGYWSGVLINQTRSGREVETRSSITRIVSNSGIYYYSVAHLTTNGINVDGQTLPDIYKKLDTAAENTKIGVWDWNIVTGALIINECWANIIGYSLEDLQPITIKTWERFAHPDDLKTSNTELEKCFRGEQPIYEVCLRMKHRDGHWVWVLDRGRVIEFDEQGKPLRMTGVHSDFTDKIQSYERMEYRVQIESLLHSITSSLIDANPKNLNEKLNSCLKRIGIFTDSDRIHLFIFRDNGQVMDNTNEWCNDGIEPCCDELKDLPTSLFPWWINKQRTLENIYIKDVKQMPATSKIERIMLENQGVKSLLAVPVHAKGELIGYIGFDSVRKIKEWNDIDIHVFESIAHAVALSLISVQAYEELIAAREKARGSDRLKSAFIATMNHEFRTPLNHIIGFSDIINFSTDDVEIKEYSDAIKNSGCELLTIMENIMEYSQLQASDWELNIESATLADISAKTKKSLLSKLKAAGKDEKITALFEDNPSTASLTMVCDTKKVVKILDIFIANAVKFTNAGAITLGCSQPNETSVIFYVKDTGIGIPEEKQKIVFDLFRQGDDSNTRRFSGTGIGLAIAEKMVKVINAEITFESSGNGSTFYLTLPCQYKSSKNGTEKP